MPSKQQAENDVELNRGDMSADEFRRYGHRLIDWIADYLAENERYPVLSQVKPGDVRRQLPSEPPAAPEPMEEILRDFERIVVPGLTHWNHPGFMAYFAITASGPGILGELLSGALNVNAMLWKTSPAATELEQVVMDWLRQMLGLPPEFEGLIYDTASISSLCAIAAAREAQADLRMREEGMAGRPDVPRLRLYMSEQAHSSIEKGALTLGIGQAGVKKIPTDGEFRMDVTALARAIDEDIKAGWRPFCVVATVGTTSMTSIDPVRAIAQVCQKHNVWLHVDAAYAGSAAILPEMRHLLDGCELADSFVVNPHKWLFTPFDLSAFYSRRMDVLKNAFSLVPEYLRTGEDEAVRNYMDYGPQLGRRFRALKLWMVIRYFGHEGLAARIRHQIQLAGQFASWVDANPDFERLAPTPLSTICFRARPRRFQDAGSAMQEAGYTTGAERQRTTDNGQLTTDMSLEAKEIESYLDRLNEALLEAVNSTGECFLSHTKLNGKFTLRLAIGNLRTTERHVARAWELLRQHTARLDAELKMQPQITPIITDGRKSVKSVVRFLEGNMIPLELLQTITTKTDTKIIQLVMDGLGGLPNETGKSELETARTPNLDELAKNSICGLADPVAKGITPGSGPGHLAIFGYDPLVWDIGRGVLEALGIGFEFQPGDVAARGNFVTLGEDGSIVDRRAGRIPTEKCVELCQTLQENIKEIDGAQIIIRPVKEHRFALILRGNDLGDRLEDTDPQKVGLKPKPAIAHDEASKKTAVIVDKFVDQAVKVLADERPANGMTLRGFSRRPDIPSMQDAYELTPAAIATYPMYRGLAKLVGMTIIETPPEEDLTALMSLLRENYDRYDYFYVHVKKTDSNGEDGNFAGKVKVIERVDEIVIPAILALKPDVLAITGDHSTPSVLAGHSWHPVPYLLHAKHIVPDDVTEFSERAFARGGLGRFRLVEGLPQLLAQAQKLLKYGA